MNLSKPIYIALVGSILAAICSTILIYLFEQFDMLNMSFTGYLVLFTTIGTATFFIFLLLMGRYISRKIRFIYGIITNRQVKENVDYSLKGNELAKLTEEATQWATVQNERISKLKEQAIFRKEFLGNLAHELKTPVFSIQGYILTLLEGGLEDERVNRDFLERALSGVDRISHLLEDLDTISRLETDRFELKIQRFDLVLLVEKVFNELSQKALEKDITLKFDSPYDPVFVMADQKRLTQVFVNLLSNSISYGKKGGMSVVSFDSINKKKILVEVSDNGMGIAEDQVPRLFERFYRVDKSRQRNIGGSGLGLSIVKHIMEAHNQIITARSTEGVGSTFSFPLEKS